MLKEQFSTVLTKNGYLENGEVVSVAITKLDTIGLGSIISSVSLKYSAESTGSKPLQLLMKESLVGDRGQSEIDFYEFAKNESSIPTFKYFGFLETSKTEPMAMLFSDLTTSHHQTPWPVIPGLDQCESTAKVIAKIHGNWWGRLSEDQKPTFEGIDKNIRKLEDHVDDYFAYVGEYFSERHQKIYELLFSNLATLKASRLSVATLVHTDPHYWNFLYPKDSEHGECVIFDWPLWRFGFGGDDLAYMIASHLYDEHRQNFEPRILQAYLEELHKLGIDYSQHDLQLDYRIGVVTALLMPLQEFVWQIPPFDWLPKLEKAMSAFDEHNCIDLLEG